METENKKNDPITTFTTDIGKYKTKVDEIVINSQRSIEDAEALMEQIKAAKKQVNATTKLDWHRKKNLYEKFRDKTKVHLKKLKDEYDEIRDKRNGMLKECDNLVGVLTSRVESYKQKLIQEAEENRLKEELAEMEKQKAEAEKAKAEKAALEKEAAEKAQEQEPIDVDQVNNPVEQKKTDVIEKEIHCKHCKDKGEIPNPNDFGFIECPVCKKTDKPVQEPVKQTEAPATKPMQISKEGQNGAVTEEKQVCKSEVGRSVEIYDVDEFMYALMRNDHNIKSCKMVVLGLDEIIERHNLKPGDNLFPGARLI